MHETQTTTVYNGSGLQRMQSGRGGDRPVIATRLLLLATQERSSQVGDMTTNFATR